MMRYDAPMPPRRANAPKAYPVISLRKVQDLIESKCGSVRVRERHGKGPDKVLILPEATRELEVMISYGRRSPMNAKEQKYIGYGHFLTGEDGHRITVVKHFIEIQTMNRDAVGASNLGPNGENNPGLDFLAYHREEFLKTEAEYNTDAFGGQVDPFLALCGPSEFVLEGHTHPDLGVFYSGTDRASGAARAASAPVCVFVCDPVRKTMLGSVGRELKQAEVVVYARAERGSEDAGEAPRALHPVDEIARLASRCLRERGYGGKMTLRDRLGGKKCLKLKLVIPRGRGWAR